MASRNRSGFPSLAQWIDHPFKSYKRAARKIDTSRAAWLKEKNDINAARAKAKLARDKELARKRKDRDAKKAARESAARARKTAAEARAQQNTTAPTVVRARVATPRPAAGPSPAATARARAIQPGPSPAARPASAASVLCGSRETDDGKPCRNPTTGGPCSAAHKPANKPKTPPGPSPRVSVQADHSRTTAWTDRVEENKRRYGVVSNEDFDAVVPKRFLDEFFGRGRA